MNSNRLAALLASIAITSGCATVSEQTEQGLEQQKQTKAVVDLTTKELTIPQGLSNPKKSEEFSLIPGKIPAHEVEVTSPTSVLVILEGSWVNDDDKHPAKIMVEKPDLVSDFPSFIAKGITSFAELNNYELTQNGNVYQVTMPLYVEQGFWFFEEQVEVERLVYNVTVDMKPHGRSGSVAVDIKEYQKVKPELASPLSDELRAEQLSIQALNDIMLEMDYLHRVKLKQEQTSLNISLAVAKDVSGNPVISSQQDIKFVWSQIEDVLEELGFSIEAEDELLHVYSLHYDKNDVSMWDSLFASEFSKTLHLDAGEYEVALSTHVDGVHIKFRTKDGIVFTEQQLQQTYDVIMQIAKEQELEL